MKEGGGFFFHMMNSSSCYWLNTHAKQQAHEISIASHLEGITPDVDDKYFSFKNTQDQPVFQGRWSEKVNVSTGIHPIDQNCFLDSASSTTLCEPLPCFHQASRSRGHSDRTGPFKKTKKISSAAYLRSVNTLIFIGLLFTLLVVSGENHTEISGSITVGDFGLSFPEFGS